MFKFRPGQVYTWSLSPTYWQQNYRTSTPERCAEFYKRWQQLMSSLRLEDDGIYYTMYADIGIPGTAQADPKSVMWPGGHMHWHGMIYFKDWGALADYSMRLIPKLTSQPKKPQHNCRIEMDTIDDLSHWYAYVTKSKGTIWRGTECRISNVETDGHILDLWSPTIESPFSSTEELPNTQ